MSTRTARVTLTRGSTVLDVADGHIDDLSWEHGVSLTSGAVGGADATVTWAQTTPTATAPASPLTPGPNAPTEGTRILIDWTEDGTTHRVFTGAVEESSGSSTEEPKTRCVDGINRLAQVAESRPIAFTMPRNADVGDNALRRRPALFGTWVTQQVMAQAKFYTGVKLDRRAVYYVSHAGSAWPVTDQDHAWAPLGSVSQVHRVGDVGAAPGMVRGDDQPCMEQVYSLGITRTRKHGTWGAWQLTWDMGTRTPTTSHIGEIRVRAHPSVAGPGFQVSWTQTVLTLARVDIDGTVTTLGTYARRASATQPYAMRWSVIARHDGSVTLQADDGRRWDLTGTGVVMSTSGSALCSVRITSPGMIGAVMVSRTDDAGLVSTPVTAQLFRADGPGRSLPGMDWIEPRQAGAILADQADAERGLRGIPAWVWLDQDGVLRNIDWATLAARPVTRTLATRPGGTQSQVDLIGWATPSTGRPLSWLEVAYRRCTSLVRGRMTILLGEGSQQTIDHGDPMAQIIHAESDTTWLHVDLEPRLAGYQQPPHGKNFDREVGTWVGGHLVDVPGETTNGWVGINNVDGWTFDANGIVQGAVRMVDPATVVVDGVVRVASHQLLSTLPNPASVGLPEHRKRQPLPQVRGNGLLHWYRGTSRYALPGGSDAYPDVTHDAGMWVQSATWLGELAAEYAAGLTDPAPVVQVTTPVTPGIKVADKIRVIQHAADGTVASTLEGVVSRIRVASLARDSQENHLVLTRLEVAGSPTRDWTTPASALTPLGGQGQAPLIPSSVPVEA